MAAVFGRMREAMHQMVEQSRASALADEAHQEELASQAKLREMVERLSDRASSPPAPPRAATPSPAPPSPPPPRAQSAAAPVASQEQAVASVEPEVRPDADTDAPDEPEPTTKPVRASVRSVGKQRPHRQALTERRDRSLPSPTREAGSETSAKVSSTVPLRFETTEAGFVLPIVPSLFSLPEIELPAISESD